MIRLPEKRRNSLRVWCRGFGAEGMVLGLAWFKHIGFVSVSFIWSRSVAVRGSHRGSGSAAGRSGRRSAASGTEPSHCLGCPYRRLRRQRGSG